MSAVAAANGLLARRMRFAWSVARARPFQALIQVTNRCNLSCGFCAFPAQAAPPADEVSLADYQRLAREMAAIGPFVVSLEGGEPFLRRDLVEIVRAFGASHFPVLFTSGWFVTPDAARELWAAGLVEVGVSIDFAKPDRHDAHRGQGGSFQRAVAAVGAFRDAPGARRVHIMTVVMAENLDDLPHLFELSRSLGVAHRLTLLSTNGTYRSGLGPSLPPTGISQRLLDLRRRYLHVRSFDRYLEGMDRFLEGRAPTPCNAGRQSFNVGHTGEVTPCIEKGGLIVGNIREAPLPVLLARLAALEEPGTCRDCWTLCRGFAEAMGGGVRSAAWGDLVRHYL